MTVDYSIQCYDVITNTRWRTVHCYGLMAAYRSEQWKNDPITLWRIWYTELESDYGKIDLTKIQTFNFKMVDRYEIFDDNAKYNSNHGQMLQISNFENWRSAILKIVISPLLTHIYGCITNDQTCCCSNLTVKYPHICCETITVQVQVGIIKHYLMIQHNWLLFRYSISSSKKIFLSKVLNTANWLFWGYFYIVIGRPILCYFNISIKRIACFHVLSALFSV